MTDVNEIIVASPPTEDEFTESEKLQKFLEDKQYTTEGILRYEFVFGRGWTSSGGLQATDEILKNICLSPNSSCLDVGCGIGGGTDFLAKRFDSKVLGVDLSKNCIQIAQNRYPSSNHLSFKVADAVVLDLPDNQLDLVYSRDCILHLSMREKQSLLENSFRWLKPGGQLLITDYCAAPPCDWSDEFSEYVKERGYTLLTIEEYSKLICASGFTMEKAEDVTNWWRGILHDEIESLRSRKSEFLVSFSEKEFNDLVEAWSAKKNRATLGIQKWGMFIATKPR